MSIKDLKDSYKDYLKDAYKEYCKEVYNKAQLEESKLQYIDKIIGVGEFLQSIGLTYDDVAGTFYIYKDKFIRTMDKEKSR